MIFQPKTSKKAKPVKTSALRITGGKFRGRTIKAPTISSTHPMGSREKMALFNVLNSLRGPMRGDELILDCYCGSGALGIEALSRGAKTAFFVDKKWKGVGEVVSENISSLRLGDNARVIEADVTMLLPDIGNFDLIFADPPYDSFPHSLDNLSDVLQNDGILVLSHPDSINPASYFANLTLLDTKSYAGANLSFYKH